MRRPSLGTLMTLVLVVSSGCETSEVRPPCEPGDPAGQSVRGRAPPSWECLCVVTLDADVKVEDSALLLLQGDTYVMSESLNESIYYFGPGGEGAVSVELGSEAPVTASCPPTIPRSDRGEPHLAVFADVKLYKDPGLTEVACELGAGTVLPSGSEWGVFSADFEVRGYTSDGLIEPCGSDTVYIAREKVMIEDLEALNPPLGNVLLPK